ncbi:MAG: hypothetical protein ACRCVU_11815 [Flavobacterium sp.]
MSNYVDLDEYLKNNPRIDFDKLVVTEVVGRQPKPISKNNQEKYSFVKYSGEEYFVCEGCGEVKPESNFRKRKGGLISTGCRSCVNVKYIPDPLRAHLNAIRCRAKSSNLPFNLTEEDLVIPEVCPILNIPIHQSWGTADIEDNKDSCPSVDRVIPSLGYVKHNVRIISARANRIKTDSTPQEIKLVYEYTMRESEKSWLEHCKLK